MKTMMTILIILQFMLGQIEPRTMPADTARLLDDLRQTRNEKIEILDTLMNIKKRMKIADSSDNGTYQHIYHVDNPDGVRELWTFYYNIVGPDTLYDTTKITYTNWK